MNINWQKSSKYFHFLGLFLFTYILLKVDTNKLLHHLSNFDFKWLFYFALASGTILVLKSIRWMFVLHKLGIDYSFKKSYKITVVTIFWGIITPGRMGEFGKLIFLKKDNVTFSDGILSIIIDRLYDIIMLSIMGVISALFFINLLVPDLNLVLWSILIIITTSVFIYLSRKNLLGVIKKLFKLFLSIEKYKKLTAEWDKLKLHLPKVFISTFYKMFILTALISVLFYSQIYFVALGFHVEISFFYLMMCVSIGSIISLIPISIGGLGTREAVFIFLLSKVFVPAESAVLISFMDNSVFALLITGLFVVVVQLFVKDPI